MLTGSRARSALIAAVLVAMPTTIDAAPIVQAGGGLAAFDRQATFDGLLKMPGVNITLDGYTEGGLVISFPELSGAFYPPCPSLVPSACEGINDSVGFDGGFFHPSDAESGLFANITTADDLGLFALDLNVGSFLASGSGMHIRWEVVGLDSTVTAGTLTMARGSSLLVSDETGFAELRLASFPSLALAEQGFAANTNPGDIAIDNVHAAVVPEPSSGMLLSMALVGLLGAEAWSRRLANAC